MKDRDGNEWRMVPADATEDMLVAGLSDCDPIGSLIDWDDSKGECITRKTVADVYKAAIAAAPQFVAGEVTKEMCWNVFEDCDGCEKNMAETARHWLDRWRKELGPALGLVEIREPTPEECARICNDALEQSDDVNADALGRTMFDAVSKWLKGEL